MFLCMGSRGESGLDFGILFCFCLFPLLAARSSMFKAQQEQAESFSHCLFSVSLICLHITLTTARKGSLLFRICVMWLGSSGQSRKTARPSVPNLNHIWKSFFPYKVVYLQVLWIRTQTFWGWVGAVVNYFS